MKSPHRTLFVLMNGLPVGKLEKFAKTNLMFTYDPSWLNTPGARPVSLSLPLTDQSFSGDIVYNFFDNLLPDNPEIRARIQAKFHVTTNQPFDLLASIGRDCVGAIQLTEDEKSIFHKKINFQPLTEQEIAYILRNHKSNPLGMTNMDADFRISIAGAQEKAGFLYQHGKWCRPLDETPTSHIFKLPLGMIPEKQIDLTDSCENEWLCAQIAEAFGLPIAKCEIQHFEDIKALIVERFDRKLSEDGRWLMRLPQEDTCQALGLSPHLKYQEHGGPGIKTIMRLLLGSASPTQDRDQFFRSQVLFWLLAATDGHAKNFSLHIEPGGKYHLTPLYDIMSMYPLINSKQLHERKIKMAMALKGKNMHYHWHGIQRRHFLSTAKDADYSVEKAEAILDEMLNNIDTVIEKVISKLPKGFPTRVSNPIFEGLQAMKRKLSLRETPPPRK